MEKGIVFNSNNLNPLAKGNGFIEISNWFWRRIISIQKFSVNFQHLPITTFLRKKIVTLPFLKPQFPSSKDAMTHVLFRLIMWFWRRSSEEIQLQTFKFREH